MMAFMGALSVALVAYLVMGACALLWGFLLRSGPVQLRDGELVFSGVRGIAVWVVLASVFGFALSVLALWWCGAATALAAGVILAGVVGALALRARAQAPNPLTNRP